MMRKGDAALIATGAVLAAVAASVPFRPKPAELFDAGWYASLDKPSFRPPAPLIGVAWTILDGLMCYAGTRLLVAPPSPARSTALVGWGTGVAGLFVYPWLMFGRHRLGAALASIGVMFGGTAAAIVAGARVDRRASWALAPLLGWLGFASVLQEELWRRND